MRRQREIAHGSSAGLPSGAKPNAVMKGKIMELSRERSPEARGLLYPLMLIAAIAVIAFSILGIASIAGWMPKAMASSAALEDYADRSAVTFECAECGVIESIRYIEQQGSGSDARPGAVALIES